MMMIADLTNKKLSGKHKKIDQTQYVRPLNV